VPQLPSASPREFSADGSFETLGNRDCAPVNPQACSAVFPREGKTCIAQILRFVSEISQGDKNKVSAGRLRRNAEFRMQNSEIAIGVFFILNSAF
jgi:hypothetical protein